MITYNDLKEMFKNGKLRDMAYEVKHNFGFYDFATEIEQDETLIDKEKVEILVSLMKSAF